MIAWLAASAWAHVQTPGFLIMIGCWLAFGLLERLRPLHPLADQELRTNVVYSVLQSFMAAALAPITGWQVVTIIQAAGYGYMDLTAVGYAGPVAVLLLTSFVHDFFSYWSHRFEHQSAVLWQEHAVHHSDTSLNVTTTARLHITGQFLFPVVVTAPIAVLFKMPAHEIVFLAMLPTIHAYFLHVNMRVSYGPLWWLLVSPQYHRIHHSIEPQHHDKNFAPRFPIWDILFGTLHKPAPDEWPATGVAGYKIESAHDALSRPFVGWWGMAVNALRKARPERWRV